MSNTDWDRHRERRVTARTAFIGAWHEWHDEPGDSPNAQAFHRAWAGLAACAPDLPTRWSSWTHYCVGWTASANLDADTTYDTLLATLRAHAADCQRKARAVDPPHPSYYPGSEPSEPTEADARAVFTRQFRAKFPGERINSRNAREQWARVETKAWDSARDDYAKRLATYRTRTGEYAKRDAKRLSEWQARIDDADAFAAAVETLTGCLIEQDLGGK